MTRTRTAFYALLLPLLAVVTGCSTSRNTAASRSYQALVTKYNVYYNGSEAYRKAFQSQEKGKKDNLLEILDLDPISDTRVRNIGSSFLYEIDIILSKNKSPSSFDHTDNVKIGVMPFLYFIAKRLDFSTYMGEHAGFTQTVSFPIFDSTTPNRR